MADVLMYYNDVLLCYGISEKELKEAYIAKFEKKLTPQIIRNSFAVHMLQNGADIKSLQELLGHEDIMATKIYLSVSKNRIIDVYDKAFPRA